MGRAAALTVGLYTFMSIAWIPLTFSVFPGDDGMGIAAGSPPMGVGAYSSKLAGDGTPSEFAIQTLWTLFWTVAYGGVALALLLATLGTFDRCLGRIDGPSIRDEDDFARDGETAGPAEVGLSASCGRSSVGKATAADPMAAEP